MAAVLILIVLAVLWAAFAFNRLVRLRNQVRTAWADIDVPASLCRHDLLHGFVAAVKDTAATRAMCSSVTELRNQAITQKSPAQLGATEAALGQGVTQLLAVQEAYPEIKANQNFLQLQHDLVEVEDNLQYARRFYNGAVRDFNTSIERFPGMLIAHAGGFTESEFFNADEADRPAVNVNLS